MRPRTVIPSLIAIAVAAALWWADGERTSRDEALERSQAGSEAEVTQGAVALSPVMGPAPGNDAPALTEARVAEGSERVAASEAEPAEAEAAIAPVMGVVVDAQGRPVAGIDVALRAWGIVDLDEDFEVVISSIRPNFQRRDYDVVRTDATGAFLFEGSNLAEGGELTFATERYLSGPRQAEVDVEATQQVLRLPDFEHQDSVWTVDVCTPAGEPLEISSVELSYRGRVQERVAHAPSLGAHRRARSGRPSAACRRGVGRCSSRFPERSQADCVGTSMSRRRSRA